LRLQEKLEKGQITREGKRFNEVQLILADGSKYGPEGELQFRDVSVDPTTGTVILRMVFPNPDKTLLPGMFVRAVVKEGTRDNAILVPQQTVARDPRGNPTALVVDSEAVVQQRMLEVDRAIGNQWLITSGLKPGEHIIAEGMQKVRPGAKVKEVAFGATNSPTTTAAPQAGAAKVQGSKTN
jgi:membrane fusion protein (multidrug efflux system)